MIPKGMEMMMKAMGVDTHAIGQGLAAITKLGQEFNARLGKIEQDLALIKNKLEIRDTTAAITIDGKTGTDG